jgi:hypothetical protein
MPVFKKKGKAKDDTYVIPTASSSDTALPSKMSRSLKRKQKTAPEPKPHVDLSVALPDTNDFRTSLLMPGLSARFSMLREQDDPTTKVGKASDDSVLFPKRASRLNLFAHNPLTDIAETESIRTTFKAPFAEGDRSSSYTADGGYASDEGGMLSRPRPTEGNNLFGGRQKMYRIPTAVSSGSSKDLSDIQVPITSAKHVYQHDVVLSPYQQMRLKSRENSTREDSRERSASNGGDDNDRHSVVNTPSTGFSKSRGTTSSTASGPSNRRTSTAATSVVSDTPQPRQSNLSATSYSRTQGYEFSSEESLLKRNLSSESRKALSPTDSQNQPPLPISPAHGHPVGQMRSPSRGTEGYNKAAHSPSYTPRAFSPPPTLQTQALASLDFGLKHSNSHLRRYQTASPTNEEGGDYIYSSNLQPNDRGKATAMGLFNRPQQQFDEQKFQERQLQMHEGRMSPPPADAHYFDGIDERQNELAKVAQPNIPSSPFHGSFSRGRASVATSATGRSRAQSTASSTHPVQLQSQVEALIKRQNEEYTTMQAQRPDSVEPSRAAGNVSIPKTLTGQHVAPRGTFFDTYDGSDEDDAGDSPMLGKFEPAPRLAPTDIHPALRDGSQTFDFGEHISPVPPSLPVLRPQSNASANTSSPSIVHDTPDTSDSLHRYSDSRAKDSPTLGAVTGLGLSGMIRTHLRHDSDRSSVLPPPSPAYAPSNSGMSIPSPLRERDSSGNVRQQNSQVREPSVVSMRTSQYAPSIRDREPSIASTAQTTNPPESTHSDPWELDPHRGQRSPLEPIHNEAIPSMSAKAQQILGQAISHKQHNTSKAQQILGSDAPEQRSDVHSGRSWPDSISHSRKESTETQKEFGDELAARARRIQEVVKGSAEAENRSRSQDRHNPAAQALHALRHKTSKTSLAARNGGQQNKAMKMLGINNGPKYDDRPPHNAHQHGRDVQQDYDELDDHYTPRSRPSEYEQTPNGRRTPGLGRPSPYPNSSSEEIERPYPRSNTPNGHRARREQAEMERHERYNGDRSRSRSRPGRPRDERPFSPAEFDRQDRYRREQVPREHQQQHHHGNYRGPPQGYAGHHGPRGPPRGPMRGPPPVDLRGYERSASAMSNRQPNGYRQGPPPSGNIDGQAPTPTMRSTAQLGPGPMQNDSLRPSPRPAFPNSPGAPISPYGGSQPGLSPALSASHNMPAALPSPSGPLPETPMSGRYTPVEGRSTPIGSRKRSVIKGMISEPTFISSTSSVPLVGLPSGPRPGQIDSPLVPTMNPRRRGNTMTEQQPTFPSPRLAGPEIASPTLESMNAGRPPMDLVHRAYTDVPPQSPYKGGPGLRPRNRLRKISSEGGGMAARARNQALMAEFSQERLRSPALPVFPNRSATSLSMHQQDGGMF